MEYLGCEEYDLHCPLLDLTKTYIKTRQLVEDLKHGNAEAAVAGDVVTALSEIFEGGHFDRIIQKELEVYLIGLRTMIREELEADEKEQLEMRAEESQSEGPAYVNAIPKNDYRRQQNSMEEKADGECKEPNRGADQK